MVKVMTKNYNTYGKSFQQNSVFKGNVH